MSGSRPRLPTLTTARAWPRGRGKRSLTATLPASWSATDGHFSPLGSLDRAQLAQVFCSFYETELDQVLKTTPDTPEQPSTPTQIPTQIPTQVLKAA